MMSAEFSLLLVMTAMVLALPVIGQVRGLAPQIEKLRQDLAAAPLVREVRYTIREVIVVPKTAEVVAFAPRPSPPAGTPGHWRKAA